MRKAKTPLLSIVFLGFLASSCCNNNSDISNSMEAQKVAFDLSAAKIIIRQKTDSFTQAHITKDTSYLNNCFASDAKGFPPNGDIVVGMEAIAALNVEWVNYGVYEFKEESISCYGNADYMIDEGRYYLRYGKDNFIDKGKYINIWKQENGAWKIFSNIWNTSLPL